MRRTKEEVRALLDKLAGDVRWRTSSTICMSWKRSSEGLNPLRRKECSAGKKSKGNSVNIPPG